MMSASTQMHLFHCKVKLCAVIDIISVRELWQITFTAFLKKHIAMASIKNGPCAHQHFRLNDSEEVHSSNNDHEPM